MSRSGSWDGTVWRQAGLGALVAVGLVALPLAGHAFTETPLAEEALIDPDEIPSVHNTFYKVPEGAVSWDTLAEMDVTVETLGPLRSVFHSEYSDAVKALDGEEVELMGFVYPLEGRLEQAHFLLTAWPPSCPFCLPAGPSQMVDVLAADPVAYGEGAVLLAGRFEVLNEDPSGFYYRLHDARLVERFEDIRWTGNLPAAAQTPQ